MRTIPDPSSPETRCKGMKQFTDSCLYHKPNVPERAQLVQAQKHVAPGVFPVPVARYKNENAPILGQARQTPNRALMCNKDSHLYPGSKHQPTPYIRLMWTRPLRRPT